MLWALEESGRGSGEESGSQETRKGRGREESGKQESRKGLWELYGFLVSDWLERRRGRFICMIFSWIVASRLRTETRGPDFPDLFLSSCFPDCFLPCSFVDSWFPDSLELRRGRSLCTIFS
jgi:hypothetical protein